MTKMPPRADVRDRADEAVSAGADHSAQFNRLPGADRVAAQASIVSSMSALPAASAVVYNDNLRDYVLSADGLTVYLIGIDGTVRAYNAETGALRQSWAITTSPGQLAISPDGSFLAVVEQEPLSVTGDQWDRLTTVVTHRIDLGTGAVTSFPFVATGYDGSFMDVEILADGRAYFSQSFSGSGRTSIWALDYSTGQYEAILDGEKFSDSSALTSDPDSAQQLLISNITTTGGDQTLVDIGGGVPAVTATRTPLAGGFGIQAYSAEAGLIVLKTGWGPVVYDTALESLDIPDPARAVLNDGTGVAFDSSGENLFVVDAVAKAIVQIATEDWTVVQFFAFPEEAFTFNLAWGNELLVGPDARYFLIHAGGTLLRVDNPTVADAITGTPGVDALTGTNGDDVIIGYQGTDLMTGLAGDDRYHVDYIGDIVVEAEGGGTDVVTTSVSYALGANSEVETLQTSNPRGIAAIRLTGNGYDNHLIGNAGGNVLDGGGGSDALQGLGGNDTYYVDDIGDQVLENEGGGDDRVFASLSYSLAAGSSVELLAAAVSGSTAAIDLTGNEFANELRGNAGANILDGKSGADILSGGAGDDIYHVDDAGDVVQEGSGGGTDRVFASTDYALGAGQWVEMLVASPDIGTAAINLTGNELANRIEGNAGANILDGKGGVDILVGLQGDDLYHVGQAADLVVETAGGGDDRVVASAGYALAALADVETLEAAAGSAAINLTGNALAQALLGNDGANILDGKGGADLMAGRLGNDFYYVDNGSDRIEEAAGQGSDRVFTTVSYALTAGAEVETMSTTLHTGTAAINLNGNEFANTITGNDGANILDGKGGADTLIGRLGDDFYYVDAAGDRVIETAGQGNDRVFAAASYALGAGASVETLSTALSAGTAAINLTGNELANTIQGNAGDNVLDGKAGADILAGLGGNDFYYVDVATDRVVEGASQGNDRIFASASYVLAAGAEVETLGTNLNAGTTAINLTGNELAQTLYGNAGANILDGKGGADLMAGLLGNDFYYVDNGADRIVESAGQGADRLFASASYTLGAGVSVETLSTVSNAGTTATNLTGNELANTLYGNAGANILDGKAGSDVLVGSAGGDSFAFTSALGATNVDRIVDFSGADDTIRLDDAVFAGIGGLGALDPDAFVVGNAAQDAGDRIVYNGTTGQLFFDADGSGTGAAVLFATVQGAPVLGASDFLVI